MFKAEQREGVEVSPPYDINVHVNCVFKAEQSEGVEVSPPYVRANVRVIKTTI